MSTDHLIDVDGILNKRSYLPWSSSRIDTAETCMYKFSNIYLKGVKESSKSLTTGSLSHEIIAELLKSSREPSIEFAEELLGLFLPKFKENCDVNEAVDDVRAMFPYMCSFVRSWKAFLKEHNIKKDRVEKLYSINENLKRASNASCAKPYFRGVIDLWCYDEETKTLYVIDHKTNKAALSANKVREHQQLNLYVAMLTFVYGIKWEHAIIGLNFLRKGKLVQVEVTKEDIKYFMIDFLNRLRYLEQSLRVSCLNGEWEPEPSFKCKWCSFKNECPAFS